MKKKKQNQKGCPLKYGEPTKMYRRRVPESEHANIDKIVLEYLDPFIAKKGKFTAKK